MSIVAVVNHKGGVGKTATTLHLGSALGRTGRRVLLLDFDPMGGLTTLLNVRPGPNILEGAPAPQPTLCPGVDLLPGGPPLKSREAWLAERTYDTLSRLLRDPARRYDTVVIDCPPQLDDFTKNAVVAAELALVPVSCDTQDLVSLSKMLETIDALRRDYDVCGDVACLITKFHDNRYSREFVEVVRDMAPRVLDPLIRYSPLYQQAGGYGGSVFDYAPRTSIARRDYGDAAEALLRLLEPSKPDSSERFVRA